MRGVPVGGGRVKRLSAIEESLALSEWAVARCWFCHPDYVTGPPLTECVAFHAQPWRGDVDELVTELSSKGLLRTVMR